MNSTDLLSVLQNEFAILSNTYKALRQEYEDSSKQYLTEYTKYFFSFYPEIKTIRWTQYTPYFNDGEECYFSVGEPIFSNCAPENLLGEDEEHENTAEWETEAPWRSITDKDFSWGDMPKNLWHLAEPTLKFKEMIESIPDEVMKEAFGDHVQITITKEGIQVEEYQHD